MVLSKFNAEDIKRVAVATFVSTIGLVAAWLHLTIFDRRFLSLSSLERVKKKNV